MSPSPQTPNPKRILATLQAYRDAAALKTAIELELFTRIAHGTDTASKIAGELDVPVRGIRLLCEYLASVGLLEKEDEQLKLTEEVARFLDRKSRAFLGDAVQPLYCPTLLRGYERLTESVRAGKAADPEVAKSKARPAWFDIACGVTEPGVASRAFLEAANLPTGRPFKILEIGSGNGALGIAIGLQYPESVIVALDNPAALRVAQENAVAAKLGSRYQNIPGDALEVPLGQGYDAVLLARCLYQFDEPQMKSLLMRIHYTLKKTGKLLILDFLAEDSAEFLREFAGVRLNMLAATSSGDAHSFGYVKNLLESSGYQEVEGQQIPEASATLVVAQP